MIYVAGRDLRYGGRIIEKGTEIEPGMIPEHHYNSLLGNGGLLPTSKPEIVSTSQAAVDRRRWRLVRHDAMEPDSESEDEE